MSVSLVKCLLIIFYTKQAKRGTQYISLYVQTRENKVVSRKHNRKAMQFADADFYLAGVVCDCAERVTGSDLANFDMHPKCSLG